jgi:host factor-I protein
MMLQNNYLTGLKQNNIGVSIYLLNGIKLSGVIADYDDNTILLQDRHNTLNQLIYKHSISSIVPTKSVI